MQGRMRSAPQHLCIAWLVNLTKVTKLRRRSFVLPSAAVIQPARRRKNCINSARHGGVTQEETLSTCPHDRCAALLACKTLNYKRLLMAGEKAEQTLSLFCIYRVSTSSAAPLSVSPPLTTLDEAAAVIPTAAPSQARRRGASPSSTGGERDEE